MTTFVLIHGSYQGGWIWRPVLERLRAQGHEALAPTLDGCAERAGTLRPGITVESQADELAAMLFYRDLDDVVLVATSSGGMVLAATAERAPERVSRLVFADALALMDGECIRDIVKRPAAVETDLALGPSPEDAASRLFAGLDPALRDWAVARITLHPRAVHAEPVKLSRFWSMDWTASVVWCRQAVNPGEAHQRRCAEALGAAWHELDTGHYPMLSTPDALTELIVDG